MRKQKTLKLREDLVVTTLELRPLDIKHALSLTQGKGDIDFERMLTENWDDALAKLSGVIRADKGQLEELSFSEIVDVKAAFLEVNAAFFGLLSGLGLKIGAAGLDSNEPLIAPASPLSSEGTAESSTTVGASS